MMEFCHERETSRHGELVCSDLHYGRNPNRRLVAGVSATRSSVCAAPLRVPSSRGTNKLPDSGGNFAHDLFVCRTEDVGTFVHILTELEAVADVLPYRRVDRRIGI